MLIVTPRVEMRPLTSERLQLSPLCTRDTAGMFEGVEASRNYLKPWLPWVPFVYDFDSTLRYIESSMSDWDSGTAYRLAIHERSTDRFLGVVGLEGVSHMHDNVELGYWVRSDVASQGYTTEAASLILPWSFSARVHRIRVAAATTNLASLRVIRKLGFHHEGVSRDAERCNGKWLDHEVFSLLKTDWDLKP